jgi:hypothetical protein
MVVCGTILVLTKEKVFEMKTSWKRGEGEEFINYNELPERAKQSLIEFCNKKSITISKLFFCKGYNNKYVNGGLYIAIASDEYIEEMSADENGLRDFDMIGCNPDQKEWEFPSY